MVVVRKEDRGQMIHIGNIAIGFIGHTTFLFWTSKGRVVITDPYFAGGFEWEGVHEQHLQRPDVRPESIRKCDVVFVSHIHGDHFDADAIETVVRNTGARVYGPIEVLEDLSARGMDFSCLEDAAETPNLTIDDLSLTALGNYDNAFNRHGRKNKFSLLIASAETVLWYSGDCHNLPSGLSGRYLDAVFCWTRPNIIERIKTLQPLPDRFIIMHYDQHTPGNFWCNLDPMKEAKFVSNALPGVETLVPDRLGGLSFEDSESKPPNRTWFSLRTPHVT
jgi:hypothetical protein